MWTVWGELLWLCPPGAYDCWSSDQKSSLNEKEVLASEANHMDVEIPINNRSCSCWVFSICASLCAALSNWWLGKKRFTFSRRAQQFVGPSLSPLSTFLSFPISFHLLERVDLLCSLWLRHSPCQISTQNLSLERVQVPTAVTPRKTTYLEHFCRVHRHKADTLSLDLACQQSPV